MKKYTLEDLKREQQEILDKIESININIGSNKNLTDDEVNKLKDEKSILEKQVEKFNKLIDIITYNILLTRSIKGHDERIVNLNNKIEVLEEEYKNGKITKEQYDQTIYNLNINLKFFKEEKDRVTRVRKRKEKEAEKIKNTLYNNEEDISNDIKKQANVNLEGYESLIKNIISDKDISNVEKKERLNTFRSLIDTAIKTLEEVDIDENKKGKIDNNLLSEKEEAYLHIIKEKEDLEKKLQEAINEMLRVFEEEKLKKENEGPFTEEELSKIEVYYYEKKQLIDREIESLKREIKKISKKQKELDNEINALNNNNATLMLEDKQAKLDNNKVLSLTGPTYENSEDKKYLDTIKEILRLGPEANNINLGYVLDDKKFVKELIANLKDKFSENELDFVFSDDIEKTEIDQEKLNDFAEYFVKSLYTKALNNSDIEIDDIENKTSDELEKVLINNDIGLEELENLFTKDNDINKDDKYNNTLNSFINLLKEEDYDYTFLLDDDYKEFYNELINKLKNMNLSDEELDKVKENDVENVFDEVFFDTIKDKIKSERGLSDEEFKSLG
ncbi:MAG: hypothetical protein IKG36_02370, partial [Mycoplasmataceae bacterium]|nr:hypothetical protein [Mycoplasmataceae bacterium]